MRDNSLQFAGTLLCHSCIWARFEMFPGAGVKNLCKRNRFHTVFLSHATRKHIQTGGYRRWLSIPPMIPLPGGWKRLSWPGLWEHSLDLKLPKKDQQICKFPCPFAFFRVEKRPQKGRKLGRNMLLWQKRLLWKLMSWPLLQASCALFSQWLHFKLLFTPTTPLEFWPSQVPLEQG